MNEQEQWMKLEWGVKQETHIGYLLVMTEQENWRNELSWRAGGWTRVSLIYERCAAYSSEADNSVVLICTRVMKTT